MGTETDDTRKKIEGRLGYRLYDCVWNRAVRDYAVESEPDRLQELEEAVEDLQQFANDAATEFEARSAAKPRRSMDSLQYLDESGADLQSVILAESFFVDSVGRAALRALSAYAALKADEDPRVAGFRRRVLGRQLLSREQATNLLHSYATRFLTLDQLRDFGVPLSGHNTSLLEPYQRDDRGEYFNHRASLRIEPPGVSLRLRYTNLDDGPVRPDEFVRCKGVGDEAIAPYTVPLPSEEIPGTGFHDVSDASQGTQRVVGPWLASGFDTARRPSSVWPGSLADETYSLAQELSESFMWPYRRTRSRMGIWWDVDAVALYLLSGTAPLIHPIKVRYAGADGSFDTPSHVVLDALPWLDPLSIFEAYKVVRKALEVNIRNQGPTKFEVVTFVLQRTRSYDTDALDFKGLRESWNLIYPDKPFKDAYTFRQSFERGLRAVQQRYHL